jgi:hypothetical protein
MGNWSRNIYIGNLNTLLIREMCGVLNTKTDGERHILERRLMQNTEIELISAKHRVFSKRIDDKYGRHDTHPEFKNECDKIDL